MNLFILDAISLIALIAVIPIIIFTYKDKLEFFNGVFLFSGALIISFFTNVIASNIELGQNIIDLAIQNLFDNINSIFTNITFENLTTIYSGITQDQAFKIRADILSTLQVMKDAYTVLFPTIIILSMLAFSYFVFMIVKLILELIKKDVSKYPLFSQLKISKITAIVFFVSIIVANSKSFSPVTGAFMNISSIIGGVCVICGISVMDFRLRKNITNSWLRALMYIAVLTVIGSYSLLFIYIFIFIAIIDSVVDFRKLNLEEIKNG